MSYQEERAKAQKRSVVSLTRKMRELEALRQRGLLSENGMTRYTATADALYSVRGTARQSRKQRGRG